MSASDRHPVRSYARLFRPERRIYAIEGHRLPIPGGLPLRWLAWATVALAAVLALASRAPIVSAALAAVMVLVATGYGSDRTTTAAAAAATVGAAQVLGYLLGTLGWPLRLVVVPVAVATVATQATPDGRAAHRYAWSWLVAQVRPERRTLGRPTAAEPDGLAARLPVAADHHGALRRARAIGPGCVRFAVPVELRHRRRRLVARAVERDADVAPASVELAAAQRLEVRP